MNFAADRKTVDAASSLIARYGLAAADEAAARAELSRDRGNLIRFCHWRQVERAIWALQLGPCGQTIH